MTPKEKAKELVDKFGYLKEHTKGQCKNPLYQLFPKQAKQCALICVDEIDKAIDFDWMEVQNLERQHSYWQEVKKEIENL